MAMEDFSSKLSRDNGSSDTTSSSSSSEEVDHNFKLLLSRMKAIITKKDSKKYNKRVKNIPWDEIAFNNHSGIDCSNMWLVIQKNIRKHRILKEVISDAEQYILKLEKSSNRKKKKIRRPQHPEQPKPPPSAYKLFCSEKREEINRENSGINNNDANKLMSKMYLNLSQDIKNNFIKREKELKQIYHEELKEFYIKYPEMKKQTASPVRKPQTPFQIYYDRQIKTDPTSSLSVNASKKQYLETWKNLDENEKIVFINLAQENERKFNKEVENVEKKLKYKSVLSKQEKLLSDKLMGKPRKPPHSAYGLFTQIELRKDEMKKLNCKERMRLVGTRWSNSSNEIKAQYISEASALKEKYKSDYDDYLKSLSEEERQELLKPKSKKRKLAPRESQIQKKRKVESQGQNNVVKPKQPPSALKLFARSQIDKSINLEEAWFNLSDTEKNKYKRKATQLNRTYLRDFELYVTAIFGKQSSKTEITSATTFEEEADTSATSSSSEESVRDDESENEENSSSNWSTSKDSDSDDEDRSDD